MSELNRAHRFYDNELLQDIYKSFNNENIDVTKYGNTECDLALCWTNRAVNKINEKWNDYYCPNEYILVNGFNQCQFKLHVGLRIIAYRTHGKRFIIAMNIL